MYHLTHKEAGKSSRGDAGEAGQPHSPAPCCVWLQQPLPRSCWAPGAPRLSMYPGKPTAYRHHVGLHAFFDSGTSQAFLLGPLSIRLYGFCQLSVKENESQQILFPAVSTHSLFIVSH